MFRSFDHHQGAVCSLLKLHYNVILARNDDDRKIETCRSIFKKILM